MTYKQSLEYLASLNKFGMNFGLARIEKLLELMEHPERRFKTVHVTGTNGKGSTTAMLAAILHAAGIKAAMYISPHLQDYTERMVINGKQINKRDFAGAIAYTSKLVALMVAEGWEHPTEFEVLTAAGFYYFAVSGVEYAVIEVGLGGLLDSTNVIVPEVAVITNVTLEHTDRCGNTVVEIARHKAGIIKQGVPVVTAAKGEALAVIQAVADELAAPCFVLGQDFYSELETIDPKGQTVAVVSREQGNIGRFTVKLLGRHQVENCAVAVMTALAIAQGEPRIKLEAIRAGLASVVWPGRFELVNSQPVAVIDGAHNPDSARALRLTLDEVFPGKDITFLLGILADKDVAGITQELVRSQDAVVLVRPLSDRAADPVKVAGKLTAKRVETADSIEKGYINARAIAGKDGVVCVAGSLYLVGPARAVIRRIV